MSHSGGILKLMKISKDQKPNPARDGGAPPRLSNSELNTLLDLQIALMRDVSEAIKYDCTRDIATITYRVRHEGFSFLSKTLCKFGDAIFDALQTNIFCSTIFKARRIKNKRTGRIEKLALPSFLFGFTSQVFDAKSGVKLPDCNVDAIRSLRQILYFLKKYEIPLTDAEYDDALKELIDVDSLLPAESSYYLLSQPNLHDVDYAVLDLALQLNDELLKDMDTCDIIPKHGPGAVQEGIRQDEKFRFPSWSRVLDWYYPQTLYTNASLRQTLFEDESSLRSITGPNYYDYGLRVTEAVEDSIDAAEFKARTARVHAVPKDSRGPRVIFIEPTGNQWIQGGLARALQDHLEKHPFTKGHINFSDQSVNRELALLSSISGENATVDWSKASDRISRALVKAVLPDTKYRAFQCCSSLFLDLKWSTGAHSYIKQRKFASMGNGICFPIESLIFWSLSVASLVIRCGMKPREAMNCVYVYGDDLIIPAIHTSRVVGQLSKYGLKHNESKTLCEGLFRESCGLDAYGGVEITPLRLKTRMPSGMKDVDGLTGWLDFFHLCVERGFGETASILLRVIEKVTGTLPVTPYKVGLLSMVSEDLYDLYINEIEVPRQKVKWRGSGFEVIEQMPFLQGEVVFGWGLQSRRYSPNYDDFPDEKAWLRWVSCRPTLEKPDRKSVV